LIFSAGRVSSFLIRVATAFDVINLLYRIKSEVLLEAFSVFYGSELWKGLIIMKAQI
jgi:hypothetical protein